MNEVKEGVIHPCDSRVCEFISTGSDLNPIAELMAHDKGEMRGLRETGGKGF